VAAGERAGSISRRTASQAVAAAVARGAIAQGRAQFWLGEIADGRATPEHIDMLHGPGHPVQVGPAPAPGPDDDMPEYLELFPSPDEAEARVDAAAAGRRAQAEALSDDELYERLFPTREP
jgi:hypothetical protein